MLEALGVLGIVLLAIVGVVWLGFAVPYPNFPPLAGETLQGERMLVPRGLPAPVERYLRAVSLDGETLPRLHSASYWGRASARPFGVWLPVRHRVVVVPGRWFTREMEFPWYGVTLLRVLDSYRNGAGETRLRGLINDSTTGPHTDQGAYLALASESIMLPSVEALQGRWEAIDEHSARLSLPYGEGGESLVVSFDPASGLPTRIHAMRYKAETGPKVGWHIDVSAYRELAGLRVPTHFEVVWEDVDRAWSTWDVEGLELNVGVPAPGAAHHAAESFVTSATPTAP